MPVNHNVMTEDVEREDINPTREAFWEDSTRIHCFLNVTKNFGPLGQPADTSAFEAVVKTETHFLVSNRIHCPRSNVQKFNARLASFFWIWVSFAHPIVFSFYQLFHRKKYVKKNGTFQMCVGYRKLNAATRICILSHLQDRHL